MPIKKILKFLKKIVSPIIFIFGYCYFLIFKKNYDFIHQAYVNTYCLTSGSISQILSFLISSSNKVKFKQKKNKPSQKIIDISNDIKKNGYSVLDIKINNELLSGLIDLTKKLECNYSKFDSNNPKIIFDKNLHKLPSYYYDPFEMIHQKEITDVIKFLRSLDIADIYFDSKSYLIGLNMWWSTIGEESDSFSAQDFHFDLDGIKWIKYFIYLNDVTLDNGPHVYVEGTHKPFSKPYSILKRGYERVKDEEIKNNFKESKIHKIIGEKGTIIIGDTSCFHKGMVPKKENRLIFEMTLSNSLFRDPSILDFNQIFFHLNNKIQN